MSLYINGKQLQDPDNTLSGLESFLKRYRASLESKALELKAKPLAVISDKDKTLYVNQHEYGIVSGDSSCLLSSVGTDMLTTHHAVILYHKDTKVAAVGHFDKPTTPQGADDMTHQILEEILVLSNPKPTAVDIDLHVIGGFRDGNLLSEKLSIEVLKVFYEYGNRKETGLPVARFHLITFCATDLNNTKIKADDGSERHVMDSPIVYGVVCNARTGELMPAEFDPTGQLPVPSVRDARSMTKVPMCSPVPSIFRIRDNCMALQPFSFHKPIAHVDGLLRKSDKELREHFSATPQVEPHNYCERLRDALQFMKYNSNPRITVFRNDPLIYRVKIIDDVLKWYS